MVTGITHTAENINRQCSNLIMLSNWKDPKQYDIQQQCAMYGQQAACSLRQLALIIIHVLSTLVHHKHKSC